MIAAKINQIIEIRSSVQYFFPFRLLVLQDNAQANHTKKG